MWDKRSTYLFLPLTLIIAIWVFLVMQSGGARGLEIAISLGLGWTLLVLAIVDWRHMILPDLLTLPLVIAGLTAITWLWPDALYSHVLAAFVGYSSFRVIALAYVRLRGRDGLGQGDAKLMAAAGAWVGLSGLLSVVMIGALTGLAYALVKVLGGKGAKPEAHQPFGSFLCLGIWITWLYGSVTLF